MNIGTNPLQQEITWLQQAADAALCSDHPWRAAYINTLTERIQDFLSSGKTEIAKALVKKLKKTIDQWPPEKTEIQEDKRDPENPKVKQAIADYLKSRNRPLPEDPKSLWETYHDISLNETKEWDARCVETLCRIRISQFLDFSDQESESWGPYNTRYNVMEAFKRLTRFNQQWLESYLLLYESFQRLE